MSARLAHWAVPAASIIALMVLVPLEVRAVSPMRQQLEEMRHSTPNLDRGAELFSTCVRCHGPTGSGTPDGLVPRIAGQHASVVEKQLLDYRRDRRWDPRMESIADRHHLPDLQAIVDVAAYVDQLDRPGSVGKGSGSRLSQGAELYSRLCSGCHGLGAEGDASRAVPRIAGQHYEYLRRQIHDAVDGRRPNYPPAHIRLLARLDHDGIDGIADYLSRADGDEHHGRPQGTGVQ